MTRDLVTREGVIGPDDRVRNAASGLAGLEVICPAGDPLPILEHLDGKIVDIHVVNVRASRTFKDERSVELQCRVHIDGEPLLIELGSGKVPADIPCYFRLPRPGKHGSISVPLRSKYYLAWTMANRGARPGRRDRMSPEVFMSRMFRGRVHTVKTSSRDPKRQLPRDTWYSTISELLPSEGI